ncbi:MAG: hypothetical protein ACXVK3_03525 [Candidatus Angelobacter sp.]
MGRWLWKIAEVLSAVVMGIFILVPSRMENEFFSNLYAEKPVLCIELLAASGILIIPTFIHAIVEQRRKKARQKNAAPNSTTL